MNARKAAPLLAAWAALLLLVHTSPNVTLAAETSSPAPTVTPTATPNSAACVGDCNSGNDVTVDELLAMVNIALGNADVSTCLVGDANHDMQITVDEILTAVNNALNGCPVPTPSGNPPPGSRTFALTSKSGFFSSLLPTKSGTPAGTLVLTAGAVDSNGEALVTLTNAPVLIQTTLRIAKLALCTTLESCTGTLYCNGGVNVDVVESLDSLKAGLTCIQDGTNHCPASSSNVCCSNSCEGVLVGSGNPTIGTSMVNGTDSGAGALLLTCKQKSATVPWPPGDCSQADFASAVEMDEFYTTGKDTAMVLHPCAGTGAPANEMPTFFKTGQGFDCAHWTRADGPGVLSFSIPSEEGTSIITGDGANAGLWSAQ
jgi:hypothetical protein